MHKIMGHLEEPNHIMPPTLMRRQSYETESSVEWDTDESEETLSFHGAGPQHLISNLNGPAAPKLHSILVLHPADLRYRAGVDEDSDNEDVFGDYDIGVDAFETDDHSIGLDDVFMPALEQQVSSSSKNSHRSVGFADVRVRNYAVTVGDVGELTTGTDSCPLSLDWDYSKDESFDVDQYEQLRLGATALRKLSVEQRRKRIAQVKGWDERLVRSLEIERVMSNIEESLQRSNSSSNDSSSSSSTLASPPLYPAKWLAAPPSSPKGHNATSEEMDQERRRLSEELEKIFKASGLGNEEHLHADEKKEH